MDTILIVQSRDGDEENILFKYLMYVGICCDSVPEGGGKTNNCWMCTSEDFYKTACKIQPRVIFIFDCKNMFVILRALIQFRKEPFSFTPHVVFFEKKLPRFIKKIQARSYSRHITLRYQTVEAFIKAHQYLHRYLFEKDYLN